MREKEKSTADLEFHLNIGGNVARLAVHFCSVFLGRFTPRTSTNQKNDLRKH